MPQVARAAFLAADAAPSVLVTTPARLGLFEHLAVLGRQVICNPGVADWAELPGAVVLDIETAVKDFPADPNRYALELRPGQDYPRSELLDRLDTLGYEREENLSAAELDKAEAWYTLKGESLEVRFNERPGRPARTLRLEFDIDQLERLRLSEGEAKLERIDRFTLGPVGGFIPDTAWTATRLEALTGRRVYLDQPEFMSGYVTPQQWTRFTEALSNRELIAFGRLEGANLPTPEPPVQALPYYRARLKAFGDDTQTWLRDGYTILAFLRHERTSDYLQHHVLNDTPVSWEWRAEAEPGRVTFVQAALEGGFILHDQKLVVVTEELLYGFQGGVTLRARKLRGPPVSDATALSVGDYLIHPEHGIGQFMGLEARPVLGVTRDYLVLRYGSEARLYLPVEQLPSLRRHPGTTDDPPRLSTLGTNEWARAREKARHDAEELARKLLIQYAARAAAPGMSFPPVPEWDALIEQNFPFTLTPDQQSAIAAVMRDLQAPHPMDRLVSGDVGFGKTEVAVRAAHRVVGNGKQVALLVPTTLLADQHLETFRDRFKGLPVQVRGLSRFTTAQEAASVLKGLKKGTVDIVIGTHRLLSQELKFKDLGLLIIDEEHRFGVMQKEKLKALRQTGAVEAALAARENGNGKKAAAPAAERLDPTRPRRRRKADEPEPAQSLAEVAGNVIGEKPKEKAEVPLTPENAVDVLSLSATPIPRTLYMSMVGLRDISHIGTPPAGRKPIRTVLSPFDPSTIRDALMLEIERGGKAFYIHDRVASIHQRAKYLSSLIPEARIAVAHGQMKDDDVEEIMLGFSEGAYDLLVATTIVESGLDIPEANTILIERSDRLGLAQLYQLRGRVGRREEEAFAFLFYPPRLTEGAERRLWAIADLADLGSGHLLAEKDMEIRGVGNILGPEQHGHIQMVSLEVYTELLAEAISKLKGEVRPVAPRVTIDLPVDARIEPDYVPDEMERISIYGRLSEAASLPEITRVERELKSRHGPPPREVQNFLELARLRVTAAQRGVAAITDGVTHLSVSFHKPHLDYDARAMRRHPNHPEITQYPPGFKVPKKGLKPDEYPTLILDLLYAFE